MSAMAAAAPPPPSPRFDSVLSFGNALPGAGADADAHRPGTDERDFSDAGSDDDDDDAGFEFAFAPPLVAASGRAGAADAEDLAPADDIFAHGRILPAYPVFDRRHLLLDRDRDDGDDGVATAPAPHPHQVAATAPPSPDTYCAWAPRSAPGSPAREFPKSASTGDARRSWRLRDLVSGAAAGGGRSHSDGKEKFRFLQPTTTASASAASAKMAGSKATTAEMAGSSSSSRQAARPSAASAQKQSRKKGGKGAGAAVTEMDMATAHKLFYGKQGGGALAGDRRQQQQSYLPYRPGIVGFFTAAHAIGRSHHPY
jgi:hypothetical protein